MIKPGLRDLIKNTWKNGKNDKLAKKHSINKNSESIEFKKLPFNVFLYLSGSVIRVLQLQQFQK